MSPEQAEGLAVDARSDIFSFGSVLYEMLSGRRAFAGESQLSTLTAILREEPKRIGEIVTDLPAEVERVIHRCHRKDPARRFQHMADVKVALEELKEESDSGRLQKPPPTVEPPVRKSRSLLLWLAAVTGLVLLGTIAAWLRWPAATIARRDLTAVALATYPGIADFPTFSPTGSQVAFMWNGPAEDNFDIYVKVVGAEPPLRLTTDPAADYSPAWSPDGRAIAFLRDLSGGRLAVMLVAPIGGPERKVAEVSSRFAAMGALGMGAGCEIARNPRSRCTGRRWDCPGVHRQRGQASADIAARRLEPRLCSGFFARWADTGVRSSEAARRGHPGLAVVDRPGSRRRGEAAHVPQLPVLRSYLDPRRSTGHRRSGNRHEVRQPVESCRRWFRAPGARYRLSETRSPIPSLSRQAGRFAYASGAVEDRNIWQLDLTAPEAQRSPKKICSSTRNDASAQFSPDGKRIAFHSNRSGHEEIWVCSSDGTSAVQVTSLGGPRCGTPRWSPGGDEIVFEANPEGHWDIFTVPASGGAAQRPHHAVIAGCHPELVSRRHVDLLLVRQDRHPADLEDSHGADPPFK